MRLAIICDNDLLVLFESLGIAEDVDVSYALSVDEVPPQVDAILYMQPEAMLHHDLQKLQSFGKLVVANAVVSTLSELGSNFVRLNGWPGLIQPKSAEIAAATNMQPQASQLFMKLNWPHKFVADVPGMISARVVAMLINEAYFGLQENISTRADIDTAMKLGTNYPYGPFEWSRKIGLKQIVDLLTKLALTDKRYEPAPLLVQESQQ